MYIEQHSRYQNKANNIQLRYDDKQFHTTSYQRCSIMD